MWLWRSAHYCLFLTWMHLLLSVLHPKLSASFSICEKRRLFSSVLFPILRVHEGGRVLVSHSWQRGYFEVFWIPFMRKRLFWSVLVSHSWERLFWSVLVSHSWEKVVVFKVYWFPIHEKEVILKCTGFPFMRKGVTLKHTSWERGTLWAVLSSTFLQTLPDLVTPLKGHFLSPRSCSVMQSAPSERLGY